MLDAQPTEAFATGNALIAPDAAPTHVWYLRSGLVRVYSLDHDGAEFNHDFVGAADWVFGRVIWRDGAICCVDRAIGAVALKPVRAVRVGVAELARRRDADPAIAAYLLDRLMAFTARRLEREADLVQRSAEERYLALVARRPELLDEVPLREIAAWLGITPVALSRIRRRVASKKGTGAVTDRCIK